MTKHESNDDNVADSRARDNNPTQNEQQVVNLLLEDDRIDVLYWIGIAIGGGYFQLMFNV